MTTTDTPAEASVVEDFLEIAAAREAEAQRYLRLIYARDLDADTRAQARALRGHVEANARHIWHDQGRVYYTDRGPFPTLREALNRARLADIHREEARALLASTAESLA